MTAPLWPLLRGLGVGLLAVAWAVAAHISSASGQASAWGAALAMAPLVLAASVMLWRWPQRWWAALVALGLLAVLVVSWRFLTTQVAWLYFVQHLGIYGLLCALFARTLGGPGESLVTQMARKVHGGVLTPRQAVYTRQVTLAWSIFFAGMVVVSIGLFAWASLATWSTFANLLGAPLVGLMFLGEMAWRRKTLPAHERATLKETLSAWRAERPSADR